LARGAATHPERLPGARLQHGRPALTLFGSDRYPSSLSSTNSLLASSTFPFSTAVFLLDGSPILLSMIPSSSPSRPQPVAFGAVNVLLTSEMPLIVRIPPPSLVVCVPGLPVGPPVVAPVVRLSVIGSLFDPM
jgi:hypothetical protein